MTGAMYDEVHDWLLIASILFTFGNFNTFLTVLKYKHHERHYLNSSLIKDESCYSLYLDRKLCVLSVSA